MEYSWNQIHSLDGEDDSIEILNNSQCKIMIRVVYTRFLRIDRSKCVTWQPHHNPHRNSVRYMRSQRQITLPFDFFSSWKYVSFRFAKAHTAHISIHTLLFVMCAIKKFKVQMNVYKTLNLFAKDQIRFSRCLKYGYCTYKTNASCERENSQRHIYRTMWETSATTTVANATKETNRRKREMNKQSKSVLLDGKMIPVSKYISRIATHINVF